MTRFYLRVLLLIFLTYVMGIFIFLALLGGLEQHYFRPTFAADAMISYQFSTDLETFHHMIEGIHYIVVLVGPDVVRIRSLIEPSQEPQIFFRVVARRRH